MRVGELTITPVVRIEIDHTELSVWSVGADFFRGSLRPVAVIVESPAGTERIELPDTS